MASWTGAPCTALRSAFMQSAAESQTFLWEDASMRKLMSVRSLLLALVVFLVPAASFAQASVGVSVRVGPPILRVYAQPVCPGEGSIWTPGYWADGDDE